MPSHLAGPLLWLRLRGPAVLPKDAVAAVLAAAGGVTPSHIAAMKYDSGSDLVCFQVSTGGREKADAIAAILQDKEHPLAKQLQVSTAWVDGGEGAGGLAKPAASQALTPAPTVAVPAAPAFTTSLPPRVQLSAPTIPPVGLGLSGSSAHGYPSASVSPPPAPTEKVTSPASSYQYKSSFVRSTTSPLTGSLGKDDWDLSPPHPTRLDAAAAPHTERGTGASFTSVLTSQERATFTRVRSASDHSNRSPYYTGSAAPAPHVGPSLTLRPPVIPDPQAHPEFTGGSPRYGASAAGASPHFAGSYVPPPAAFPAGSPTVASLFPQNSPTAAGSPSPTFAAIANAFPPVNPATMGPFARMLTVTYPSSPTQGASPTVHSHVAQQGNAPVHSAPYHQQPVAQQFPNQHQQFGPGQFPHPHGYAPQQPQPQPQPQAQPQPQLTPNVPQQQFGLHEPMQPGHEPNPYYAGVQGFRQGSPTPSAALRSQSVPAQQFGGSPRSALYGSPPPAFPGNSPLTQRVFHPHEPTKPTNAASAHSQQNGFGLPAGPPSPQYFRPSPQQSPQISSQSPRGAFDLPQNPTPSLFPIMSEPAAQLSAPSSAQLPPRRAPPPAQSEGRPLEITSFVPVSAPQALESPPLAEADTLPYQVLPPADHLLAPSQSPPTTAERTESFPTVPTTPPPASARVTFGPDGIVAPGPGRPAGPGGNDTVASPWRVEQPWRPAYRPTSPNPQFSSPPSHRSGPAGGHSEAHGYRPMHGNMSPNAAIGRSLTMPLSPNQSPGVVAAGPVRRAGQIVTRSISPSFPIRPPSPSFGNGAFSPSPNHMRAGSARLPRPTSPSNELPPPYTAKSRGQ